MTGKIKKGDLAKKLGLSSTLVSLVLNNKGDQYGIKRETQEKVLYFAKKLGVIEDKGEVNADAPPSVGDKPRVVGMVIPSVSDPYVISLTIYLQKAFQSIGFGFVIISRWQNDEFEKMIVSYKSIFSGLILLGEVADDNVVSTLKRHDYPFVVIDGSNVSVRLNSVGVDNKVGASIISSHINKMGYSHALIIRELVGGSREVAILDEAMKDYSINTSIVSVSESITEEDGSYQQVDQYMRRPFSADVIVVMKAYMVFPLIRYLCDLKRIRIPYDVALVSMEDLRAFECIYPSITSLKKPIAGIAVKATDMLWKEIKNAGNSKYKRQIYLPPELAVRGSCGSR